jgi:EF hand
MENCHRRRLDHGGIAGHCAVGNATQRRYLAAILLFAFVLPTQAYSDAKAKAFTKADKQINSEEFRALIDELAAIGAEKAVSVKRWGVYGMGFSRADANGDGMISIPELKAQK